MAVLGRLLLGSAERLDLPDLLSIDSFTAADFKYLIQSFIGAERPYILRGFEVIQPQDAIGTEGLSIGIADSIVYFPTATAGSFYHGLEEGNVNATALVPELRKNATNFVYLTLSTSDTAQDSRAFWDPDQNGGDGGEFSQDINTESVLTVEVGVSVSTFPDGSIPVCKVIMDSSAITDIQDTRDMMFRLGTGGVSPDPFSTYDFRANPSSLYSRDEPSTIMSTSLDPNPFQGGDKNIFTLKEWMDVVMTRIKEISGETYWYSQGGSSSGTSVSNTWHDALGSTLKSKGEWQHDSSVAGRLTWTEDIQYHNLTDPRVLIIRDTTIDIANDGDVAYIEIKRDLDINTSSTSVTFSNGDNFINGVVGAFENTAKGDWIKKASDPHYRYLRIDEFYALPGLAGGPTTPALAQSVRLSGTYAGASSVDLSQYTKGEYLLTDIQIDDRADSVVNDIGGNFFWLGYRSDTNLGLEGATPTQLSVDIEEADGIRAKCTSAGHGLVDGDRITITTGTYAGTHQVSVEDANIFYINTATTGDELAQTAFYAIVETRARNTGFTYELESANHGFESNQQVSIQNSLSAYDGSYLINTRSATTFQIPIGSLIADPGPVDGEIVSLVRVNVKTEFGLVKVVQGESIDIGDPDTTNILSYIGMPSLAMTKPVYSLPLGYNALNGQENYNSLSDDDLTTRVSKLTAMMADRVQERGFSFRGRVNITSVTNGANQDISGTGSLTLHKPSSPEQAIDLTTVTSLPANSAAVATIDRDGGTAVTLSVVSLGNSLLLGENDIIMFYRFAGTTVYTWDDQVLEPAGHINFGQAEDSQNRNVFVFNPGRTDFNMASGLLGLDVDSCPEITDVTVTKDGTGLDVAGAAFSWFIFSANDVTDYYVWYDVTDGANAQSDPGTAGTGIKVDVLAADTTEDVATKTAAVLDALGDFSAYATSSVVTVTNAVDGPTTDASDGDTTFTFSITSQGVDPAIEIIIHGSSDVNTIDTDTINGLGTLIVPSGSSAWVRVNRFAAKTFNTVLTTDVPDTDIAGAIYVTPTADVPIDQDVFVLWMRNGDNLLEMHKAVPPDENIYEERMDVIAGVPSNDSEIQGPVSASTIIPLPLDSRDLDSVQRYIVGAGQLEVELNGQVLLLDEDYAEVGGTGCPSNQIQISQGLVVDDILKFRLATRGSVFFASTGVSGTLQESYDAGRFITTNTGQPIVISGPVSEKLLVIQGDIDVTGVIDPIGLELTQIASNPLSGGSNGIWVNPSGELVYEGTNVKMDELKIVSTTLSEAQLTNLKTLQDGSDILNTLHHHDNRYYTETELDAGQLDNRYYTETELDAGQLDNRYYTETELDAGQLDNRYYTETELSNFTVLSSGSTLIGDDATVYTNITPLSSTAEASQVDVTADSSDSLNNTYFLFESPTTQYYAWYNTGAGSDPTIGGRTGIEINIATNALQSVVATASAVAIGLLPDFSTADLGTGITITNTATGPVTDTADGGVPTGFGFTTLVQGVTAESTVRNTLQAIDSKLGSFSNLFINLLNDTGVLIPAGSVVTIGVGGANEMALAKADDIATVAGVAGVTIANVPQGTIGQVQIAGIVTVLGNVSTYGSRVYVSDSTAGSADEVAPTVVNSIDYGIGTVVDTNEILLNLDFENVNLNVYDETMTVVSGIPADDHEIQGPVVIGTTITIPLDGRNGDDAREYIVGAGMLEVFLNGQYLETGDDWTEIGAVGAGSTQIEIQRPLSIGDELFFRIDLSGDIFVSGSGGGGQNNSGLSVGTGAEVFREKLGLNLIFRSLSSGTGISIVENADDITISTTGATTLNVTTETGPAYNATLTDDTILADAVGAAVTVNLPAASTASGKIYHVKKIDASANSVVISPNGGDLIDNLGSLSTTVQYETFSFVSDGVNKWWII